MRRHTDRLYYSSCCTVTLDIGPGPCLNIGLWRHCLHTLTPGCRRCCRARTVRDDICSCAFLYFVFALPALFVSRRDGDTLWDGDSLWGGSWGGPPSSSDRPNHIYSPAAAFLTSWTPLYSKHRPPLPPHNPSTTHVVHWAMVRVIFNPCQTPKDSKQGWYRTHAQQFAVC